MMILRLTHKRKKLTNYTLLNLQPLLLKSTVIKDKPLTQKMYLQTQSDFKKKNSIQNILISLKTKSLK